MTLLPFAVVLSILVIIHELGHFIVAKRLGMKVEEFGFGFPPRIFGWKKGETDYTINAIPFGGFVKVYGEDETGGGKISLPSDEKEQNTNDKDLDRAFFARSTWQRMSVVVAGVVMNAILAIVIFYIFLFISGFKTEIPPLSDYKFFGVNQTNKTEVIIRDISKNSPAASSGIRPLSKVLTVENVRVQDLEQFVTIINNNKEKEISITFFDLQKNENYSVTAVPRSNVPKNEGALGVSIGGVESAVLNFDTPLQKAFSGITHPVNLLIYNFDVIGKLIAVSVEKKTVEPVGGAVSGPVGIFKVFDEVLKIDNVKERVLQILNVAGILSISLAFFNILPIPALDGGRLFFILIEVVFGKKVPQKFETIAHTVGFAVLMSLIVLITFKDIRQFFF